MKYREMEKFLNDQDIGTLQPWVASCVSSMLPHDVSDDEFEAICEDVINEYLSDPNRPSELINIILKELKTREIGE